MLGIRFGLTLASMLADLDKRDKVSHLARKHPKKVELAPEPAVLPAPVAPAVADPGSARQQQLAALRAELLKGMSPAYKDLDNARAAVAGMADSPGVSVREGTVSLIDE